MEEMNSLSHPACAVLSSIFYMIFQGHNSATMHSSCCVAGGTLWKIIRLPKII